MAEESRDKDDLEAIIEGVSVELAGRKARLTFENQFVFHIPVLVVSRSSSTPHRAHLVFHTDNRSSLSPNLIQHI